MARKVPTTPIEIAKLRSTVDEGPGVPEEEVDEDEDAVSVVVPEPLPVLVCVDKTVVVLEGSRTSKLNHIKLNFPFPVRRQLTRTYQR